MKPRGTLGASDIAALFGVSPWQSHYGLWCRETGLLETEEDETNERMQIGNELERPVLDIWARRMGWEHCVVHNRLSSNHASMKISATPDGFLYDETANTHHQPIAVIDVKTVDISRRRDWDGGLPHYYWWQLQQQMLCTGSHQAYLVALFGVNEISHQVVEWSPEAGKMIEFAQGVFWDEVDGKRPPPQADGHEATRKALLAQERHPEPIIFGQDVGELDAELQEVSASISRLNKRERELKNKILRAMGDSSVGLFTNGAGYRVQTVERKEYTAKATKYQKFTRFKSKETEEGEDE